jgi:GT2 family glycosyltransferase
VSREHTGVAATSETSRHEASIAVIICAYTDARSSLLAAAVQSVRAQSLAAREIIVVVDHNPALLAWVRAELPGVVSLENRYERGLSGARNSGVEAAQGTIVAFLDDDAFALPDWLLHLHSCYANPRVVGAGGAIAPRWEGGRPAWFPPEFDWVIGCTYRGMPVSTAPVRNLIGANMSLRRQACLEAGGFRSVFGRVGASAAGCEETELCIRLRQRDPRSILLYEPHARVLHHVPNDRARRDYFFRRCLGEGRSKAQVASSVGSADALSAERSYTLRTLPLGCARGVAEAFVRGDAYGIARAGAIAGGLAATTLGYVAGRLNRQPVSQEASYAGR